MAALTGYDGQLGDYPGYGTGISPPHNDEDCRTMVKKIVTLGAMCVLLQACAWVELTPAGEKTRVLSAAEVTHCKRLGTTTASVKAEVAGIGRAPERVQEELESLARNSAAADLKGDTIVPIGKPKDGKQVFEVYRCVQ